MKKKMNTEKKWTWSRYIFTNIVMLLLSIPAAGFVGYVIWVLLSFIFLFTGQLIGANTDYSKALPGSTENWFIYIGVVIGVIIQFLWLWEDEMKNRN